MDIKTSPFNLFFNLFLLPWLDSVEWDHAAKKEWACIVVRFYGMEASPLSFVLALDMLQVHI